MIYDDSSWVRTGPSARCLENGKLRKKSSNDVDFDKILKDTDIAYYYVLIQIQLCFRNRPIFNMSWFSTGNVSNLLGLALNMFSLSIFDKSLSVLEGRTWT